MKDAGVSNEKIMSFLVEMDERITNIGEQVAEIKEVMVTKDELELLRQEIREEFRPFSDAIDKDAKTIIDHERRIGVLERKVV